MDMQRIIAHLDMDAFFASVEERNSPIFKGKPIVVGSDPKQGNGRGVVSTANYKAREYGIHSAMPISHAWKASQKAQQEGKPEAIFVPPDFPVYEKIFRAVYHIIKKHTAIVEPASIDEFYFDLSYAGSFKKAQAICKRIKKEVLTQEKLTCSIGVGPNKLIAKITAGISKPNGFFMIKQNNMAEFLAPLPIRTLPGIGPKTAEKLQKKGIRIIKDLQQLPESDFYEKAMGIDHSPVIEDREVKSIGEQNTFEHDTLDAVFLGHQLQKYCAHVFSRLKESGFTKCKTISITVRFHDFQTFTSAKSFTPPLELHHGVKFHMEALKLLLPYLDRRKNPRQKLIRLLGVRVENLVK